MKKVIAVLLVMLLLSFISACGSFSSDKGMKSTSTISSVADSEISEGDLLRLFGAKMPVVKPKLRRKPRPQPAVCR